MAALSRLCRAKRLAGIEIDFTFSGSVYKAGKIVHNRCQQEEGALVSAWGVTEFLVDWSNGGPGTIKALMPLVPANFVAWRGVMYVASGREA